MHTPLRTLTYAFAAALAIPAAFAADGQLDSDFGTDAEFPGYGFYPNPLGNGLNDATGKVVAAADGSLYLVGRISAPGGSRLSIEKTDADGYPVYEFGSSGLRSYVQPCTGAFPVDAEMDGQGRLWMAIGGCDDYLVYRFLPNGEPDVSLLGSGVASIAFNRGGANEDHASQMLLLPDGGFVVAGWVETATNTHLGVAQFTSSGLPDPGFGVGGKVVVPFELDTFFVNGLHRMDDGRLMIDGSLAEGSVRKHFVVRLQPGGGLDISYGNSSAGISKYDFKNPLNLVDSATAADSWMERDGSLIQVGSAEYASTPNSARDVLLVRWRSDGLLDLTVGPHGARRYTLDYAGALPADPSNNSDSAEAILREGNGRYLISVNSNGPEGNSGVALLRLKRNLDLDTSFGSGGKVRHFVDISATTTGGLAGYSLLQRPGRVVVPANAATSSMTRMHSMVGIQEDVLFADTFD